MLFGNLLESLVLREKTRSKVRLSAMLASLFASSGVLNWDRYFLMSAKATPFLPSAMFLAYTRNADRHRLASGPQGRIGVDFRLQLRSKRRQIGVSPA